MGIKGCRRFSALGLHVDSYVAAWSAGWLMRAQGFFWRFKTFSTSQAKAVGSVHLAKTTVLASLHQGCFAGCCRRQLVMISLKCVSHLRPVLRQLLLAQQASCYNP